MPLLMGPLVVSACGALGPASPMEPPPVLVEIRIAAEHLVYRPEAVGAPAGVPLRLVLENRDTGIPHTLALLAGPVQLAQSEVVAGPDTVEMDTPGLAPGAYQLQCLVHPTMVAVLTVD